MAMPEKVLGMTDKEKLALLDEVEDKCWKALKYHTQQTTNFMDAEAIRSNLYSIEIIKEMRCDYQEDDDEEGEDKSS